MKRSNEPATPAKTAATNHETSSAALWVVLARAYRSMAAFVERSVAALDIGLSDFMILEALLHKGPLTMSELSEAKQDRRVRRVQLTAQGSALIKRLYARHERDLDEVMSGVPTAERAELRRALKTIGLAAQAKLS